MFQTFKEQIDIKKIAILLAIQVVLELLRISISAYTKEFACVVIDVFTLISWIIVYFVLTSKSENFIKNKKAALMAFGSIIFAFLISLIFDIKMILEYQTVAQKYEFSSEYMMQTAKNLDFEHSIQNLIFDCVLGFVFILFHIIAKDLEIEQNTRKVKKEYNIFVLSNFIWINWIKITILLLAIFAIIFLKIIICRDSVIKTLDISSPKISNNDIQAQSKCIYISRMSGHNTEENIYNKSKTTIHSGETKLGITYSNNDSLSFNASIHGNQMSVNDFVGYEEGVINDVDVYVFNNEIVCFNQNGTMRAIKFENMYNCEESEILTEFLRQLISEGNVIAFEYGVDYLLQYDNSFIEPYILRYATEDFASQEHEFFNKTGYKKEYIVDIAKSKI